MSVTLEFALNEQPATGAVNLVPLGGNGFTAPQSMYEIQATLAGDVSGGTNKITFTQDPRFSSLLTLANNTYVGNTGPIEVGFEMRNTAPAGPFARGFSNASPLSTINGVIITVWNPPPIMTMDLWACTTPNVDGDTSNFNAWVYNFNIRVLEVTPMFQILANLPRPGSMDMAPSS